MRARDLAWVAGIIEGEGSISVRSNGLIEVHVNMTDLDVIQRLAAITGVGRVTGPAKPPRYKAHWKPIAYWQVARQDDTAALLMTIFPFLGARRRAKAAEALATWRARPISVFDTKRRRAA